MAIRIDLGDMPDMLRDMATKQIPFVTSLTTNRALSATRKTIHKVMDAGEIEGGLTPFTRKQLQMNFTRKNDLRGSLYFSKKAFYMKELIDGGVKKGKEGRTIPEPDKKNPPSFKVLTDKGNLRKNYIQNAMRLAGTPSNAQWQRVSFAKGKTKPGTVTKGAQGYQIGASRNGTYGLWRWTGKKGARKPELIMYLSRKSRQQRPTFGNARDIAQESFTGYVEQNFVKNFGDAMRDTINRYK